MESEWKTYRVEEFADVVGGGTPRTKIEQYWNGDIPWITPKDLSDHKSRYISHGERFISSEGLENSSAKMVPERTVLLSSRAPVGYLAIAKNPLCTNQGFRSLVVKEGFSPEFIYYLLKNNVEYLQRNASGTTFQELSGGTLKTLEFKIPDFKTQCEIAETLGAFDDKIELNQRMNETLEAIARAIFKSWFVDFDPVKAKMAGEPYPLPDAIMSLFPDALVESDLGMIPKGWEVRTISDLSKVMIGGDWGKEEKNNGYDLKIRCLRGTDLEKLRKYGYSNEVPVRWIKKSSYKKRSLDEFDIIIASSGVGPLGRPLWINPWLMDIFDEPITYSNFTKRIRAKTKELAIYLDRILYEMRVAEKIWEFSTGTSIPNLDINSLVKNHLILVPNKEIIKSFARHMLPIYEKLFSNENQILAIIREEYSLNIFSQM